VQRKNQGNDDNELTRSESAIAAVSVSSIKVQSLVD